MKDVIRDFSLLFHLQMLALKVYAMLLKLHSRSFNAAGGKTTAITYQTYAIYRFNTICLTNNSQTTLVISSTLNKMHSKKLPRNSFPLLSVTWKISFELIKHQLESINPAAKRSGIAEYH